MKFETTNIGLLVFIVALGFVGFIWGSSFVCASLSAPDDFDVATGVIVVAGYLGVIAGTIVFAVKSIMKISKERENG